MKTKHTPGEWGVAMIDCGEADDEIVTEVNGCLVSIAAVFGACEYSEARLGGNDEPRYVVSAEEAKANAEFIVCACNAYDELLASLEEILPRFDAFRESTGLPKSHASIRARTAIAKAKGLQP